jgi:hypothetical protein
MRSDRQTTGAITVDEVIAWLHQNDTAQHQNIKLKTVRGMYRQRSFCIGQVPRGDYKVIVGSTLTPNAVSYALENFATKSFS